MGRYATEGNYGLNPGDFGYAEWVRDYERSEQHRTGDRVEGIDAWTDEMGNVYITATVVADNGVRLRLCPYFNQCDESNEGEPSDGEQIDEDETAWLVSMAGATEWYEAEWLEV